MNADDSGTGGHTHGTGVKGASVKHMSGAAVGDADERVIAGHLGIVTVSSARGESVELRTAQNEVLAMDERRRESGDGRRPRRIGASLGVVELYIPGTVGKQDLPGGKLEHAAIVGRVAGSIGNVDRRIEVGAVPFEELRARNVYSRAGHAEHISVRKESGGTVGDVELLALAVQGKIWGSRPLAGDGVIDGIVAGCAHVEDGAVGTQNCRTQFVGLKIDEFDNGAAGA